MVEWVSAPVTSGVIPPVVSVLTRIFMVSAVVRSGEITSKCSPRSVETMTRFPAA